MRNQYFQKWTLAVTKLRFLVVNVDDIRMVLQVAQHVPRESPFHLPLPGADLRWRPKGNSIQQMGQSGLSRSAQPFLQ